MSAGHPVLFSLSSAHGVWLEGPPHLVCLPLGTFRTGLPLSLALQREGGPVSGHPVPGTEEGSRACVWPVPSCPSGVGLLLSPRSCFSSPHAFEEALCGNSPATFGPFPSRRGQVPSFASLLLHLPSSSVAAGSMVCFFTPIASKGLRATSREDRQCPRGGGRSPSARGSPG